MRVGFDKLTDAGGTEQQHAAGKEGAKGDEELGGCEVVHTLAKEKGCEQ